MSEQTMAETPVWLEGIAEPRAMWQRAATGEVALPPLPMNAHVHLPPNFSAFGSVAQAVDLAAKEGLAVLGGSNYYDYSVYKTLATEARARGIFPLFGLEIITLVDDLLKAGIKVNDPGNPGKFYICGKGITRFDPMNAEATSLLQTIRERDSERMTRMTERLAELTSQAGLTTGLTAEGIKETLATRYSCPIETVYLQERHVAQALQEAIFTSIAPEVRADFLQGLFGVASKAPDNAVAVQNEIRSHLMKAGKTAYIEETFVDFDHAWKLILALGGIPCYPTLIDGANPICRFEAPVEAYIDRLKERCFTCAELIPIRNSPEVLTEYVVALRKAGLAVTAGTEHNTPDLIPLAPTCVGGAPIPDAVQAIFQEGACVVAAHQYLTAMGEAGFVDSEGRPNPDFTDAEERIQAFARLGAAVIAGYRQTA